MVLTGSRNLRSRVIWQPEFRELLLGEGLSYTQVSKTPFLSALQKLRSVRAGRLEVTRRLTLNLVSDYSTSLTTDSNNTLGKLRSEVV